MELKCRFKLLEEFEADAKAGFLGELCTMRRKWIDFAGWIGLQVRPPMSKPIRLRKKCDYIRFRPYHVFSTPAKPQQKQELFARVRWLVAIIALIEIVGITASHRH